MVSNVRGSEHNHERVRMFVFLVCILMISSLAYGSTSPESETHKVFVRGSCGEGFGVSDDDSYNPGHELWQRYVPNIIVPHDVPSIQGAVDVACPNDVILVLSGTYVESVTIDIPLYLIGANVDPDWYALGINVSMADWPMIVNTMGPGVTVLADNVTVESFQVAGGGIVLDHVRNASVMNNVVTSAGVPGIDILGTSESRVWENEIVGGSHGIRVGAGSNENQLGSGNSISGTDVGIWIGEGSSENEITLNKVDGCRMGLVLENAPNNIADHNELLDQEESSMHIWASDLNTIIFNTLSGAPTGLSVVDSSEMVIQENLLSAENDAISLQNVLSAELSDNTVTSQNGNGIHVISATVTSADVSGNTFRGSPASVLSEGTVDISIKDNKFGGGDQAVTISGATSAAVRSNTFQGQSEWGVRILNTNDARVQDNEFYGGAGWAVEGISSPSIRVEGNSVLSQGGGIRVEDSTDSVIEDNELTNATWGLLLANSPGSEVRSNEIARCDTGIELATNGARVYHNAFDENDIQVSTSSLSFINYWDDGSGRGNFWSDYGGEDTDADAVGDTDLPHQEVDAFPLTKKDFEPFLRFVEAIEEARGMLEAADLNRGILNSMTKKLDHAQDSLVDDENPASAEGALDAFSNSVDAQSGKHLSGALADDLLNLGSGMILALGDVDFDGDGALQRDEEWAHTDPHDPDTDGDFAGDGCEIMYGLRPLWPIDGPRDSDGDGLVNYLECLFDTNPFVMDQDDDSFEGNFIDGEEFVYWTWSGEVIDFELALSLTLAELDPWDIEALREWSDDIGVDVRDQFYHMGKYLNKDDVDDDGLKDGWEVNHPSFDPLDECDSVGGECHGYLEIDGDEDDIITWLEYWIWNAGRGTDPMQQDVIVEVDWIIGFDPRIDMWTFRGGDADDLANWDVGANGISDILEAAVYAWDEEGKNLIIVYDDEMPASTDGDNDQMSRREANRMYDDWFDMNDRGSVYRGISRYGPIVDQLDIGDCGCSGITPALRADFFISAWGAERSGVPYVTTNKDRSGTFLHELGHALGLDHGGRWDTNHKPNYNSVMSYRFQMQGVDGNGDYDCNDPQDGRVTYSHGTNPLLDEGPYDGLDSTELNANCGGGPRNDTWLGERGVGINYVMCFHFGMTCAGDTNLRDYDDWAYIESHLDVSNRHVDL